MVLQMTWFIAVLIFLIIEITLSIKWSPYYFNYGIKLYSREINTKHIEKPTSQVSSLLNNSFKATGYFPSICFNQIDNKTIAFREKLFEFALFTYTPIMHGKIEINNSKINVAGYANWFPISFLALWYSSFLKHFQFDTDIIFIIVPILIFAIIYVIQFRIYNNITKQLSEITKQNNPTKS